MELKTIALKFVVIQFFILFSGKVGAQRKCRGAFDMYSILDRKCLRFAFMDILQGDLDKVVNKWNNHHIRRTNGVEVPHGIPNVLYLIPEDQGTQDYKCIMSQEEIDWALSMSTLTSSKSGSSVVDDYFRQILRQDSLRMPMTWDEALQLYFHFVQLL